ncbi:transcription termination/antitermination protein NusG [Patescibacteria group bacterium]|nr:transcription termination/antitermination protein NusG [Patescibacteria group bacterium]MCL5409412.1 transcription termination/antitermination protein NusG [Patescibacteria group bacterium]
MDNQSQNDKTNTTNDTLTGTQAPAQSAVQDTTAEKDQVLEPTQPEQIQSELSPTEPEANTVAQAESPTTETVRDPQEEASQETTEEFPTIETTNDQPEAEVAKPADDDQTEPAEPTDEQVSQTSSPTQPSVPGARWYVVHTYSGHENRVATALKQRVESEHLGNKILDVLVPTQDKIEIRSGKKETVKEKIFPGYILVRMVLDDASWLAVRTTQGVTAFIGMGNKPTPIPDSEVSSIVKFMEQGGQPSYKTVYSEGDTVKIADGPFAEFIGKVESVDKERGKIKVLVSIFGRETPVELDFLQVNKL